MSWGFFLEDDNSPEARCGVDYVSPSRADQRGRMNESNTTEIYPSLKDRRQYFGGNVRDIGHAERAEPVG